MFTLSQKKINQWLIELHLNNEKIEERISSSEVFFNFVRALSLINRNISDITTFFNPLNNKESGFGHQGIDLNNIRESGHELIWCYPFGRNKLSIWISLRHFEPHILPNNNFILVSSSLTNHNLLGQFYNYDVHYREWE